MVCGDSSGPSYLSWKARWVALAPLACTPTTRIPGLIALAATDMPAINPPPPIGTTSVYFWGCFQDFQRDRALAGHHGQVVKRVDVRQAFLGSDAQGLGVGFIEDLAKEDHSGAVALCCGHLG